MQSGRDIILAAARKVRREAARGNRQPAKTRFTPDQPKEILDAVKPISAGATVAAKGRRVLDDRLRFGVSLFPTLWASVLLGVWTLVGGVAGPVFGVAIATFVVVALGFALNNDRSRRLMLRTVDRLLGP